MDRARIHHQWMPDVLFVEADALSPETAKVLERRGHELQIADQLGEVHSVRGWARWRRCRRRRIRGVPAPPAWSNRRSTDAAASMSSERAPAGRPGGGIADPLCRAGRRDPRRQSEDVADFVRFFRVFVAGYHHEREEKMLFPALVETAEVPADRGPLPSSRRTTARRRRWSTSSKRTADDRWRPRTWHGGLPTTSGSTSTRRTASSCPSRCSD